MNKPKSCPFCEYEGISMRVKTDVRGSVSGLTYLHPFPMFDPVSLGYAGERYEERLCLDYRFGVKFYCRRCGASTNYTWGQWHVPTPSQAEEFDAYLPLSSNFDENEEADTIARALEKWNRRAQ